MNATVSAVIPTHNRARVLERALRSVAEQTAPVLEVVVVDDGSDDSTPRMLAERFPKARVLSQPRRGVAAARNRGIRAARGEWIALLDSDDEWLPEKLAAQLETLGSRPGLRLAHTDEIWMRRGVRVNPGRRHRKSGGWIFRRCLPLCLISPSSALLHRTVFEDVGFFDESLPACEDYDFWLRFTARNEVAYVDRPLVVKHGGRPDQLSRTVEALDRYRIRSLEKLLSATELESGDRAAAARELVEKIAIYRAGASRRGRSGEVRDLERLAARFAAAAGRPETACGP